MGINLKKELESQREISIKSTQDLRTSDIKNLLTETASRERDVLKEAGLDREIVEAEKKITTETVRANLELEFGCKIFTKNEIKTFCLRYRLRFLGSRRFKGKIDPMLGAKIMEFFNGRIDPGTINYEAANNLYVLAPYQMFDSEKNSFLSSDDPAIFYKVRKNDETYYALVHQWGGDFSFSSRLVGFVYEKELNMKISLSVLCFFAIFLLPCALFSFSFPSVVTFGLLSAILILLVTLNEHKKTRFTEDIWEY